MKALILLLIVAPTFNVCAQTQSGNGGTSPPAVAGTTMVEVSPFTITQRGPHHRVWEKVLAYTNAQGQTIYWTNSYVELATGLNAWNGTGWVEANDQIHITTNGASAINTQHQVSFAANINTAGSIDLTMPNGEHLRSQIIGLAYYDEATSNSVMFAETKDSFGQLLSTSNQVIYTNAFTDFQADVRYTQRRNGFEQDVILRSQPPSPVNYGLNPQSTRLQIWTEFLNPPEPAITAEQVAAPVPNEQVVGPQTLPDERIIFNGMEMDTGKAFSIDGETNELAAVPVAKQWFHTQGRTFLIEEVLLPSVAKEFQTLPPVPSSGTNAPSGTTGSGGRGASLRLNLPAARQQAKVKRPLLVARENDNARPGLVLDYNILINDYTNFTFQSDTTYYISGEVDFYGKTTIEGGTVIKGGDFNGGIVVEETNFVCLTAPYRPAIFTCTNDDSVGTAISGSSGSPNLAITTYLTLPVNGTISNMFFRYAWNGVSSYAADVEIWDCQFIKCNHPITVNGGTTNLGLHNLLITMDDTINSTTNTNNFCGCDPGALTIYSQALNIYAENITADLDSQDFMIYFIGIVNPALTSVYLTNSIMITPNLGAQHAHGGGPVGITPNTNTTYYSASEPVGLFQSVGAANYYLADGSPYRDYGNINLSAALLMDIKTRTTYPPVVISTSGTNFGTNLNLFPQAQRDAGIYPDLGYHYDPIDFAFSQIFLTNATMNLYPGTVITVFTTNGNPGGIGLGNGAQFVSLGTPNNLCRFVEYNTVQEQSTTNWSGFSAYFLTSSPFTDSIASSINARFTDFSIMEKDFEHLFGNAVGNSLVPNIQDCQFHGGRLISDIALNLTNSLLERVVFTLRGTNSSLHNCLFWRGSVLFLPTGFSATVNDNMFDLVSISDHGGYTQSNNGFNYTNVSPNVLSLTNASDVFTTNFTYQTSWLGRFYQTNTSPLIDKGSTTADQVGLYHYTTQTNQTIEATSTVDIGFHYVAVDTTGIPLDADSDGVPDYVEDANGNGVVDSGETNWQDPNDLGLNVIITRPANNSIIP